jgi:hypothetical protein
MGNLILHLASKFIGSYIWIAWISSVIYTFLTTPKDSNYALFTVRQIAQSDTWLSSFKN